MLLFPINSFPTFLYLSEPQNHVILDIKNAIKSMLVIICLVLFTFKYSSYPFPYSLPFLPYPSLPIWLNFPTPSNSLPYCSPCLSFPFASPSLP